MMRKLAVALALASTVLASPSLARDKSWYVGVEGGAMIVEDIEFDVGEASKATVVDSNYGYDVDGTVGYDFGAFRVETEVGYRRATVDGISSTVATPIYANGGLANLAAGNYDFAGGSTSALSFMLNGLLDFGDDDGVQGFVGGGVGVDRVKANYALSTGGSFLDDSDTVFAWQGLAGVRAPLSANLDVTFKYRFFITEIGRASWRERGCPYG